MFFVLIFLYGGLHRSEWKGMGHNNYKYATEDSAREKVEVEEKVKEGAVMEAGGKI